MPLVLLPEMVGPVWPLMFLEAVLPMREAAAVQQIVAEQQVMVG
jgi:hypothetical protein